MVARLESAELRFDVKAGPTGSLFGSVTATTVADRLWEKEKIRIDRRKLELDPIKRIGRYTAPLEVFQGVTAELRLVVVPEGGELPPEEELEATAAAESEEATVAPETQADAVAAEIEPIDGEDDGVAESPAPTENDATSA
jgi:hypothetical protein